MKREIVGNNAPGAGVDRPLSGRNVKPGTGDGSYAVAAADDQSSLAATFDMVAGVGGGITGETDTDEGFVGDIGVVTGILDNGGGTSVQLRDGNIQAIAAGKTNCDGVRGVFITAHKEGGNGGGGGGSTGGEAASECGSL